MKVQVFGETQLWHKSHIKPWLVSKAIRSATGGRLSHVGFKFGLTQEDIDNLSSVVPAQTIARLEAIEKASDGLCSCFFESVHSVDPLTKKTGVCGPYPWHNKEAWYEAGAAWHKGEKRYTRRLEVINVYVSPESVREMIIMAVTACDQIEYAKLQIVQNWLTYRLRRAVPINRRSANKWTCCEFVARLLVLACPQFAIDLQIGNVLYDELSPSSGHKRAPGLWERLRLANK